jgi:ribonucleotide monophosphatase NagD (HAD superfamily)
MAPDCCFGEGGGVVALEGKAHDAGMLIDLEGTICLSEKGKAIPGAAEWLGRLSRSGVPFKLVPVL